MRFTACQIAELLGDSVVGDGGIEMNNVLKDIDEMNTVVSVCNEFAPENQTATTLMYVNNKNQAFASLFELIADAIEESKKDEELFSLNTMKMALECVEY